MPIDDVTVVIRWILALALGVAAAWLAYGRVGALTRSRATLLGALRALAVTIVAAILFGAPSAPPRPAAPLVAIDVSASSRRAVGQHLMIGLETLEILRGDLGSLHSRKLRSFDEPPFR